MKFRLLNDVAFHFVFGRASRKYNLLNLLNAILTKTGQEPIQDLELQETTLDAEIVGLKSCRLDIRAITSESHHINVEVQLMNRRDMEKRSLYYSSRLYTTQLNRGENYRELNKTIAINILDFARPTGTKFHSIYKLLEIETGEQLTDALEIHFLELPRLKENPMNFDCPLTRWMMVLSDDTDHKDREAILMQDEDIRRAYEDLGRLSADKDTQRLYEIREDAARDYRSGMDDARQEGLEQGLEKGLEQGLEKGRQEGSFQEKLRMVKRMLAEGLDEELIKKTAELTQAELDELKQAFSTD